MLEATVLLLAELHILSFFWINGQLNEFKKKKKGHSILSRLSCFVVMTLIVS